MSRTVDVHETWDVLSETLSRLLAGREEVLSHLKSIDVVLQDANPNSTAFDDNIDTAKRSFVRLERQATTIDGYVRPGKRSSVLRAIGLSRGDESERAVTADHVLDGLASIYRALALATGPLQQLSGRPGGDKPDLSGWHSELRPFRQICLQAGSLTMSGLSSRNTLLDRELDPVLDSLKAIKRTVMDAMKTASSCLDNVLVHIWNSDTSVNHLTKLTNRFPVTYEDARWRISRLAPKHWPEYFETETGATKCEQEFIRRVRAHAMQVTSVEICGNAEYSEADEATSLSTQSGNGKQAAREEGGTDVDGVNLSMEYHAMDASKREILRKLSVDAHTRVLQRINKFSTALQERPSASVEWASLLALEDPLWHLPDDLEVLEHYDRQIMQGAAAKLREESVTLLSMVVDMKGILADSTLN